MHVTVGLKVDLGQHLVGRPRQQGGVDLPASGDHQVAGLLTPRESSASSTVCAHEHTVVGSTPEWRVSTMGRYAPGRGRPIDSKVVRPIEQRVPPGQLLELCLLARRAATGCRDRCRSTRLRAWSGPRETTPLAGTGHADLPDRHGGDATRAGSSERTWCSRLVRASPRLERDAGARAVVGRRVLVVAQRRPAHRLAWPITGRRRTGGTPRRRRRRPGSCAPRRGVVEQRRVGPRPRPPVVGLAATRGQSRSTPARACRDRWPASVHGRRTARRATARPAYSIEGGIVGSPERPGGVDVRRGRLAPRRDAAPRHERAAGPRGSTTPRASSSL